MKFAIFMTTKGMRSGIVIQENKRTVIVRVVTFGQASIVSGISPIVKMDEESTRRRVKDRVIVYPEGITPIYGQIAKKKIEIKPENNPLNFPVVKGKGRYGWGKVVNHGN